MAGEAASKARRKAAPLDVEGLLAYAARILSARAQTIGELRQKLVRKAAQRSDVDEVMRRLKENGIVDDRRFAQAFAEWRRDGDGFGKARVVRDLMARRVAPELARKAAESVYSGADEPAMIQAFLERKYRGKQLEIFLSEEKNLAAAYRRLRTAGFSPGNSVRVLKNYAARAADVAEQLEEMAAAAGDSPAAADENET